MTRLDVLAGIAASALVHVGLAGGVPATGSLDAAPRVAEASPRCMEADEVAPFILDPLPPLRIAQAGPAGRA
jgi:hypothetical protein